MARREGAARLLFVRPQVLLHLPLLVALLARAGAQLVEVAAQVLLPLLLAREVLEQVLVPQPHVVQVLLQRCVLEPQLLHRRAAAAVVARSLAGSARLRRVELLLHLGQLLPPLCQLVLERPQLLRRVPQPPLSVARVGRALEAPVEPLDLRRVHRLGAAQRVLRQTQRVSHVWLQTCALHIKGQQPRDWRLELLSHRRGVAVLERAANVLCVLVQALPPGWWVGRGALRHGGLSATTDLDRARDRLPTVVPPFRFSWTGAKLILSLSPPLVPSRASLKRIWQFPAQVFGFLIRKKENRQPKRNSRAVFLFLTPARFPMAAEPEPPPLPLVSNILVVGLATPLAEVAAGPEAAPRSQRSFATTAADRERLRRARFAPELSASYPPDRPFAPGAGVACCFCAPSGLRISVGTAPSPSFASFVLTDEAYERSYGHVLTCHVPLALDTPLAQPEAPDDAGACGDASAAGEAGAGAAASEQGAASSEALSAMTAAAAAISSAAEPPPLLTVGDLSRGAAVWAPVALCIVSRRHAPLCFKARAYSAPPRHASPRPFLATPLPRPASQPPSRPSPCVPSRRSSSPSTPSPAPPSSSPSPSPSRPPSPTSRSPSRSRRPADPPSDSCSTRS